VATDNRLMAVPIRFSQDGTTTESGTPVALFATPLDNPGGPVNRALYMVAPGGRSFIVNSAVGDGNASPISVILNWTPQAAGAPRPAR